MEIVSLKIAKKISRRNLQKGQTAKMYQKQNNCSVYDLKDNYKNAYCSYEAPNMNELIKIAEWLRFSVHLVGIDNINDYANKLIELLKYNKITLEGVRI